MMPDFLGKPIILISFLLINDISSAQVRGTGKDMDSNSFTFYGEQIVEYNKKYDSTLIGGLSGIEYYSGNIFYLISDDYGEHGPPRFYKVSIDYTKSAGIKTVNFLDVKNLGAPEGKIFASSFEQKDSLKYIFSDAESIRYDKSSNNFMWSSEGFNYKEFISQPFVFNMDTNGLFINKINTDSVFLFDSSGKKGPQRNATFESLSLIPGTNNFIYCTERSLIQDINLQNDTLKPIRIALADKISGNVLSEVTYMVSDIYKNNSNGVVEILALSRDTFLVLERAYEKQKGTSVRLYQAIITNETSDVRSIPSLKNMNYTPMQKELLLDFSTSGVKDVDNIEGMTWGYPLSKNKRTILFLSDNNFNTSQISQILLFEYDAHFKKE